MTISCCFGFQRYRPRTLIPSIALAGVVAPFGIGLTGVDGGGVYALSAARFSETPNSFPPEVAASSVIQMSDSGRREFSCSRICGQKLRSFTAVISGVAVLS